MATWFTRLTIGALALASFSLNSCQKDESKVTINPSAAPKLTASTASPDLVLTQANANTTGSAFTYTSADFGYQAAATYTLQVDKKGGNFTSPQSFSAGTSGATLSLTKAQLTSAFLNLGIAPGTANAQVDVRVVATVGTISQISPVVTLTGTPTPICVANTTGRNWSLIGPAGTDWNTDRPLTYDCYSQSFKATMALNAGEFKFRANNDWSTNFGVSGATSTVTMSTLAQGVSLVNNNQNLQIMTAGTYNIVLTPSLDGTSGTVTIKP